MKTRLAIILCLLLSACSTLPPAIRNPPAIDISFPQASKDFNRYKGSPVRWGGVIIDVLNEQDFSRLQVMAYPLNDDGRPTPDKPHEGRFFIHSREFLDPAIYGKDREVTAAGLLNDVQEITIGKKTLKVPVIDANTIHLWPEYKRLPYYYDGFYPYFGYYGYYGYPYYWGGGFYRRFPRY